MTIIIFIVILAVLIFVHELGHFWAAKIANVQVEEFAIGFPPRIVSYIKNGTRYCLNLFPLGGYVKLLGEMGESKDHNAFVNKPVGSRLLVVVAGVLMNIGLAIILLTIGFMIGMAPMQLNPTDLGGSQKPQVYVVELIAGSAAAQADIKPGDQIVGFNAGVVKSVAEIQDFTKLHQGQAVNIDLKRENKDIVLSAQLGQGDSPLGAYLTQVSIVKLPFGRALYAATKETWLGVKAVFEFVGVLFRDIFSTGKITDGVTGPVGIYNVTKQAAKLGFSFVLQLAAVISLNLAVINIIPFPGLDGGRGLFILLEAVFRRKVVRDQVEQIIHVVGFGILLLLIIAITAKDIVGLH